MVVTIKGFGIFLNQYANLLLVLVTAAYVFLTWRTLKALRQASLREREARHLGEIKNRVIQPIIFWIKQTVLQRYTGKSPRLLYVTSGYGGNSWRISHTVDDPFTARSRLATSADSDVPDILRTWGSLEGVRVSRFLFDHAKQQHFPEELRGFDQLLQEARQLADAFISFTNECAQDMMNVAIPWAQCSEDANSMAEWVNLHSVVVECVQAILLGKKEVEMNAQSSQNFYVLMTAENQPMGRAAQREKLEKWLKLGFERVHERWELGDLAKRAENLLKDADSIGTSLEQLLFYEGLDVDCALVSGRKRRPWYAGHRKSL
jgi:hypothetical protein